MIRISYSFTYKRVNFQISPNFIMSYFCKEFQVYIQLLRKLFCRDLGLRPNYMIKVILQIKILRSDYIVYRYRSTAYWISYHRTVTTCRSNIKTANYKISDNLEIFHIYKLTNTKNCTNNFFFVTLIIYGPFLIFVHFLKKIHVFDVEKSFYLLFIFFSRNIRSHNFNCTLWETSDENNKKII